MEKHWDLLRCKYPDLPSELKPFQVNLFYELENKYVLYLKTGIDILSQLLSTNTIHIASNH